MSTPPSLADSFERLLAEPADAIVAPLTSGTIVAGRYEVVERIGAGAMGMVYLAKDRDLERKIALKIHRKRAGTEQLRREALAMARLAHPNVVTVFEVGEHEGRTFVAMEYVAGVTLRQWLTAERRTPNEIIDMLVSAGEGLVAAHDAKLVHRDFKPENVLIGSDGRARVSDFGLARETGPDIAADGSTGNATGIAGTPAYMAPEQALGISVDTSADQYAFCGVAWEALVGPWPRTDKATKLPRVRRVLERGLSKDPAARYPSMRALLAALRATRSRKHLVLGGVAVALVAAGGAAAFAWPPAAAAIDACNEAGIEITTFGLDLPARVSASQPAAVVELLEQRLAAYRSSYIETAKKVCVAGLVDRTWSTDLYRRGVNCLEIKSRVSNLQFSDVSTATAANILDRAVRLPGVTTCADATVIASQPALPEDPALVDEIIRVRAMLDASVGGTGANLANRLAEAIALAEASSVRTQPTIAGRIDFVRGQQHHLRGELDEGNERYKKAYFAARAIDDPDLALGALASLVVALGDSRDKDIASWLANGEADAQRARTRAPEAAAKLYIVAAATHDGFGDFKKGLALLHEAIALLGDTPSRSLADALMIRASMLISDGKPTPAYADYIRAISMFETLYGKAHPIVAKIKITASAGMDALGRKDEGMRLAMEGEAILATDTSFSASDLAQMKLNVAASYINAGEFERGKALLTEARELTLKVMGPDDPDLALIDTNYVYALVGEKKFAEALALAASAMTLMDRTTPRPHEDRGQLFLSISDAQRGLGKLDEATTAAEASAAEFPRGDERKIRSLLDAASAANDAGQPARALANIEKIRALPPAEDHTLQGRLELEHGRALTTRDPAAARKALDAAHVMFTEATETQWIERVDAARAKLR